MEYLKRTIPFSFFGLVLIVLSYMQFYDSDTLAIRVLSVYLGCLGMSCFIASFAHHKYPVILWVVRFTVINIFIYFIFSIQYAIVIGRSIVLVVIVSLLELILGVFLIEIYRKSKTIMEKIDV